MWEKNHSYVCHVRSADRRFVMDGTFYAYSDDPTRGVARWTVQMVGADGSASSTYVELTLTYPADAPAPAPNPQGLFPVQ
jgi:hypothetical protein